MEFVCLSVLYKMGLNNFMGVGEGAEFSVVVGCVLFGMHFSTSKNALLLYLLKLSATGLSTFLVESKQVKEEVSPKFMKLLLRNR